MKKKKEKIVISLLALFIIKYTHDIIISNDLQLYEKENKKCF